MYKLYSKKDIHIWKRDFDNTISDILKSKDKNKNNYSINRLNLDEIEEISIIYFEDKIVAFSSIWHRELIYPKNTYRVLNRAWKHETLRWRKPAYWEISKLMLDHQIKIAQQLNIDNIFISSEGNKKKWIQKWVSGANKDGKNFNIIDGMVKVCNGDKKSCWQHVAYMNLNNEIPNFQIMTYQQWLNE